MSSVKGEGSDYDISDLEGEISEPELAALSREAAISVSDLYFSIPARRKFLKSAQVELRHIIRTVRRFGLCQPNVRFTLTADDKEVMTLSPMTLIDRIAAVHDPSYRENLLEVNHQAETRRASCRDRV